MLNRRQFVYGALAAPVIIRNARLLMPISQRIVIPSFEELSRQVIAGLRERFGPRVGMLGTWEAEFVASVAATLYDGITASSVLYENARTPQRIANSGLNLWCRDGHL